MGQFKRHLMEEEAEKRENEILVDFLRQLEDREELQGAASGIAKQVIKKGVGSMTKKQRTVIDGIVERYKKYNKCSMCSNANVFELTDYIHIKDTGICPTCEIEKDRFMNEE